MRCSCGGLMLTDTDVFGTRKVCSACARELIIDMKSGPHIRRMDYLIPSIRTNAKIINATQAQEEGWIRSG